MLLSEQEIELTIDPSGEDVFGSLGDGIAHRFGRCAVPIRFVVPFSQNRKWHCEVGILAEEKDGAAHSIESIFHFRRRVGEDTTAFNAVLLVPTGIGADIGGHAGDAGPVARLIGGVCDTLIIHPNVVNASDINEMPENALYVEGSVITRLLMGTVGLQRVRANRVLVIIETHPDAFFVNLAVNTVGAARATYGLRCPAIVQLVSPLTLRTSYTSSGRAAGRIEGLQNICQILDAHMGSYDAVSISSMIEVPHSFHREYFQSKGEMVNPWGGVEAMLTHALSTLYRVPTAHSPMLETREIANADTGIVDPRMAAEAISDSFFQCTLKGLMRSPRIVTDSEAVRHRSTLTVSEVSCLIIPDGCLGLPTIAALHQGIPVIAVRENRNVMRNDLSALPWRNGQFVRVENYWEAAGVMAALRAGIAPESVRRPLAETSILKAVPGHGSIQQAPSANHPVSRSRMYMYGDFSVGKEAACTASPPMVLTQIRNGILSVEATA